MVKNSIIVIVLVLIIIGFAVFFGQRKEENVSPIVSNQDEAQIRAAVTAFGSRLQSVSLLASNVSAQIDTEYSAYLSPSLLSVWKADPTKALGRSTSSPWPDRIEISSVIKEDNASYIVEGKVIEITSADTPSTFAAAYPVTLTLEKIGDAWEISSVQKGAYLPKSVSITISGIGECLPHKDTSGPQTLECAFGVKEDITGKHYAVDLHLVTPPPSDFPTGVRITVAGTLVPKDALNTNTWNIYPIEGIIAAASVKKI